ncbi:MAG: CHAT domain-containing protein [Pyrinomonadaceae bacterium]
MYEQHAAGLIRGHLLYNIVQADYRYRIGEFENSLQFLEDAAADELTLFASSGTSVVTSPFPRDYDRLFSLLLEKLSKKIGTEEGENNAAEELTFRFLEQRRYRSFRNMIVQSGSKKIASTLASENEKMALAEIEKIKNQLKNNNDHNLKNRLRRAYSDYENAVIKEQFSIEIQKAIATAHPVKLKTAQANLDEKTALIEYVFVGEKTIALVLTKDKLKSFPLTVTRSNLKNKTRILQTSVFSKDKNHRSDDWEPISRNLRESLIEPIERSGALKNKNRLAIIPFGFLHDLPFAMLTRNENGKTHFLIEDYVLFFPPSATFLTVNETKKETAKLVSFGRNSNDMADLPPLKFAVRESESVAEIFSGEAKLENKASETEFKDSAPKATHLHIAAHAIAEPEMPLFSRLLLKSTDKDDGKLTTREIFELGINANLVTIAACEGARSFSADSEGLIEIDRIGLTEAFLHAGSRSVLASLSPASDEATTELMQSFYKNLLSQDKATSLALAQREMLRREVNNRFTHPRYWANFVLIGTDR